MHCRTDQVPHRAARSVLRGGSSSSLPHIAMWHPACCSGKYMACILEYSRCVPVGALVGDEVEAETALLKADGTVQLPASSAVFGVGGSQALSVWPLTGSSADLRQGGQVTALLRMRLTSR